jgi:hypothetical protein
MVLLLVRAAAVHSHPHTAGILPHHLLVLLVPRRRGAHARRVVMGLLMRR